LNVGPRPSVPLVDAGAVTQLRLNSALPIANARRSRLWRSASASANALGVVSKTVPAPPDEDVPFVVELRDDGPGVMVRR
jgi:hypothetical protein